MEGNYWRMEYISLPMNDTKFVFPLVDHRPTADHALK